jgi:hypothetical protein
MLNRLPAPIAALALLLAVPLVAQPLVEQPAAPAKSLKHSVPRTPDGHPDFQGTWTNVTLTPFERPAGFEGKATLSEAEAALYEKKEHRVYYERGDLSPSALKEAYAVGAGESEIWEGGSTLARVNGSKRTSLVIDPPDGKVPDRTPEAKRRMAEANLKGERAESVKDLGLKDRCLAVLIPVMPVIYNSNYQIVQTPDHVMILGEMVHDARVVRMNGTHPAPSVRHWMGDSTGRWEGDTLVVDTTNFNGRLAFWGSSENVHVTERFGFDSTGSGTLVYRATIDDPSAFTKPWSIEFAFVPTTDRIFEYACHEGNSWVQSRLKIAREADAK